MLYILTFEDGSSAFLAHHGVKGMKWGVWNEETKARYFKTTKGGQFTVDQTHPYKTDAYGRSEVSRLYGDNSGDVNANLVRFGKNFTINLDEHESSAEDYESEFKEELSSHSMEPEPIEEAFSKVNNLYGAPGYDDNCMGCSIATILRMKGFDVEADSSLSDYTDEEGGSIKSLNMNKTQFIHEIFDRPLSKLSDRQIDGQKIYENGTITDFGKSVRSKAWETEQKTDDGSIADFNHADRNFLATSIGLSEPEGSYGVVRGGYNGGGGHIMTYRIENGRPVVYDGQTSEKQSFEEATKDFNFWSITTARLDDADIDYRSLGEWGGVRPHDSYLDKKTY